MIDDLISRLRVCAEQSEMGLNFADTPRATRQAAEALILLREALAEARALLLRYRNETPIGHQPHMICLKADQAIEKIDAALTPTKIEKAE